MQYRRISADCHLDLPWLPRELFVSEASRELKDRMPYVEEGPDGKKWTTRPSGVLDQADAGYQALARGEIVGRAIVVP